MLVNEIDIKNYNAKLLTVDIQNSSLSNESEWTQNALTPTFIPNKKGFKVIKLGILFKGSGRDEILKAISDFTLNFKNEVVLKLDNYKNYYKCILTSKETIKTVSKIAYKVSLELNGYEFGEKEEKRVAGVTEVTVNNIGNEVTPCIIEITPNTVDLIDFIISGVSDSPIIIKTLRKGETVIVDGVKSKVTINDVNKYGDTDMWEFPRLYPGVNNITFSRDTCTVKVKWKPFYF